jgi:transcriptional regulator with XRE-family HTH domain
MAIESIDWPVLLRDFRKARGLKQEAAAAYFGVSQASISRWENGASQPTTAMCNRLFTELRRDRCPIDTPEWVATFRRLPVPGAVVTETGIATAVTGFLADKLGLRRDELEGLGIDDIFAGEVLDLAAQVREQGGFKGRVASAEACLRLGINPQIQRELSFNVHLVNWPHFCDDGTIVRINQGVFLTDDQLIDVRERLGAGVNFHNFV